MCDPAKIGLAAKARIFLNQVWKPFSNYFILSIWQIFLSITYCLYGMNQEKKEKAIIFNVFHIVDFVDHFQFLALLGMNTCVKMLEVCHNIIYVKWKILPFFTRVTLVHSDPPSHTNEDRGEKRAGRMVSRVRELCLSVEVIVSLWYFGECPSNSN